MDLIGSLVKLWEQSGFVSADWKQLVMIGIACILLYLGIVKEFEPLLMVGIAFGMLLSNLPMGGMYNPDLWVGEVSYSAVLQTGGILDFFYIGIKTGLFPSLIFMGVGAMTDFGPMIANPKSMLLGAAAQLGIYMAFILAILVGFTPNVAASIGIIGGADGPTAIWLTKMLAPEYLAPIAIAAYSYMALIPLIQPPIMKVLTTKAEREIKMDQLRPVSKTEKIVFPIVVTIITCILLPSVTPLLGCFMLGNLFRETGVTERLSDTIQNALMNIVTIMLSTAVGATAVAENFLKLDTILIIILGLAAFSFATFGGIIFGKVMCKLSKGKINPLIGSAGVSAVPMAARVSQMVGQKANPGNYLLMHAMGPNVSGVIGSAVAAGFLLAVFG
jgi:sodium ion-translocating decarboxylase beta subunit